MIDYEEVVIEAIRVKDGKPVFNGSIEHAAILLSRMFKVAQNNIRILSRSLNPKVYSKDIALEMQTFLNRGGQIRIIIEDDTKFKDHPIAHLTEDCEIRKLHQEIANKIPYHMTVIDDFGYRFEGDKNLPQAIAAFGDSMKNY